MKKYELLQDDTIQHFGRTLYRIRALVAIGALVSPGDLGGYIEKEENLSQVSGDKAIVWFSCVGSENGTLTVCKAEVGLFVSRGCFAGDDVSFLAAVEDRHGDSRIGREYKMLIAVARSRILGED